MLVAMSGSKEEMARTLHINMNIYVLVNEYSDMLAFVRRRGMKPPPREPTESNIQYCAHRGGRLRRFDASH